MLNLSLEVLFFLYTQVSKAVFRALGFAAQRGLHFLFACFLFVATFGVAAVETQDFEAKAFTIKNTSQGPVYSIEAKKLAPDQYPRFEDDLNFEYLQTAIERQLHRFTERSMRGTLQLGTHQYSVKQIEKSLKKLQQLIKYNQKCQQHSSPSVCMDEFHFQMQNMFDVFKPTLQPGDKGYHPTRPGLFTAYYTPTIYGSLKKTKRTPFAIYRMPKQADLKQKTFVDIALRGALDNQGLEIFYAPDLFDLYLLHVQGGGRVVYKDKQGREQSTYIQYTGTNKQAFDFISNYMFKQGYIKNKSIAAQKKFLADNPDKWAEIYAHCPSYVYFEKTPQPPWGSDNVSLTPNRSIALDSRLYRFKGLLTFVQSVKPAKVGDSVQGLDSLKACRADKLQNFSRFFLHQDTGGAIRGKARGDLYFGEDNYAACVSYNQYHRGHMYFLMLK